MIDLDVESIPTRSVVNDRRQRGGTIRGSAETIGRRPSRRGDRPFRRSPHGGVCCQSFLGIDTGRNRSERSFVPAVAASPKYGCATWRIFSILRRSEECDELTVLAKG
jgi:hypothetical protein